VALDTGTANPIPSACIAVAVLMPTTRPVSSRSGPPELPGLIAASVWMNRTRSAQRGVVAALSPEPGAFRGAAMDRPRLDTIPNVTVWSRPMGWPMATTQSPTRSVASLPIGAGGSSDRRLEGGTSTASTATSVCASAPTTLAPQRAPEAVTTATFVAPWTTCAFVKTSASAES